MIGFRRRQNRKRRVNYNGTFTWPLHTVIWPLSDWFESWKLFSTISISTHDPKYNGKLLHWNIVVICEHRFSLSRFKSYCSIWVRISRNIFCLLRFSLPLWCSLQLSKFGKIFAMQTLFDLHRFITFKYITSLLGQIFKQTELAGHTKRNINLIYLRLLFLLYSTHLNEISMVE